MCLDTRCDCVTGTHAIEFDLGSNWAEAIIISISYRFDYSTNKLINHLTKSLYWKLGRTENIGSG